MTDEGKAVPCIEDEINELLCGDLRETALGFTRYLRANQLTPKQWFGPRYWRIPHGEYYLCGIVLNENRWRFWFFSGDYCGSLGADIVETVRGGVSSCVACTNDCPQGTNMAVFGKEYANVCFQFPIQFENPDHSVLRNIEALIEYWKDVAPRSGSWHSR